MTDAVSKEKRSETMRAVKSKNNKSTELRLIQIFKANGVIGWRRNYKLPGKPDFVFPKLRVAVFTDGCFWHGHGCRKTTPAQNADYWRRKIERNQERDRLVTETLTAKNWRVIRVWECELKGGVLPEKLSILRELTGRLKNLPSPPAAPPSLS